jgi:hypothetical protein
MNYYSKYLKYKNKYIELKNQSGGMYVSFTLVGMNNTEFKTKLINKYTFTGLSNTSTFSYLENVQLTDEFDNNTLENITLENIILNYTKYNNMDDILKNENKYPNIMKQTSIINYRTVNDLIYFFNIKSYINVEYILQNLCWTGQYEYNIIIIIRTVHYYFYKKEYTVPLIFIYR